CGKARQHWAAPARLWDERFDRAAWKAPVATRRHKCGDISVVRPPAQGRGRDSESAAGLAEAQPRRARMRRNCPQDEANYGESCTKLSFCQLGAVAHAGAEPLTMDLRKSADNGAEREQYPRRGIGREGWARWRDTQCADR